MSTGVLLEKDLELAHVHVIVAAGALHLSDFREPKELSLVISCSILLFLYLEREPFPIPVSYNTPPVTAIFRISLNADYSGFSRQTETSHVILPRHIEDIFPLNLAVDVVRIYPVPRETTRPSLLFRRLEGLGLSRDKLVGMILHPRDHRDQTWFTKDEVILEKATNAFVDFRLTAAREILRP